MTRERKDRVQTSINFDPEVWEAIRGVPNRSDVVNMIMRENLERLDHYTKQDRERIVREYTEREVMNMMKKGLPGITRKVTKEMMKEDGHE